MPVKALVVGGDVCFWPILLETRPGRVGNALSSENVIFVHGYVKSSPDPSACSADFNLRSVRFLA